MLNEPPLSASDGFIKSSRFWSIQDDLLDIHVYIYGMTIQFEYCSDQRQTDECNVRNTRQFLFGMSPDIPAFKVLVLQVTLNFELE